MANNGDIYLGQAGSEVLLTPFGRKLNIITIENSRSGRTASGKLRKDISSVKYRFELPYSIIDGDGLQEILDLYDLRSELRLLIYFSSTVTFLNDISQVPVVLMDPLSRERFRLAGAGLWQNSSLILNEV